MGFFNTTTFLVRAPVISRVRMTNEQANLMEVGVFNILLGGSYTHPLVSEVILKEEKEEPILNVDS